MTGIRMVATLLGCILLAACATQRPVLYPSGTLARDDVDQCMRQADHADLQDSRGQRVAERAAVSGTIGAVTGAAAGAVAGNAGRGAGIGAAAGTANGLMHGLFSSHEPDPLYRAYVERCLRDRGYDTIGWR